MNPFYLDSLKPNEIELLDQNYPNSSRNESRFRTYSQDQYSTNKKA